VVIKKISVEKSRVEIQNASLPGYELGSRGIELSCGIIARKELGGAK
jgi:hypothetical protein